MQYTNSPSRYFDIVSFATSLFFALVFCWLSFKFGQIADDIFFQEAVSHSKTIKYLLLYCVLLTLNIWLFGQTLLSGCHIRFRRPTLIMDDTGISRPGFGVLRDLHIRWDNISTIKTFRASKHGFRIWLKKPAEAWMPKNPLLVLLTWLKSILSLGMWTSPVEVPFFQGAAFNFGLSGPDFVKIVDENMTKASTVGWRPQKTWKDYQFPRINRYLKLVYAVPIGCLIAGYVLR